MAMAFAACGVNRQAKELRALEKCRYEFISVDSLFLAGTDINKLVDGGRVDLGRLPGVAIGFLNRDIPLSALLNIRVNNPTNALAGIKQFTYKIAVDGNEVLDGTSDLPIEVPPGETVIVPVKLQANAYKFLADRQTLNKLVELLRQAEQGNTGEQINLTFKIKPTIALGNKEINYPGYISFDKQVDAGLLIKNGVFR